MARRKKVKKKPFILLFLLLLIVGGGFYFVNYLNNKKKIETRQLASSDLKITLKDKEGNEVKQVARGVKAEYFINQDEENIAKIKLDNEEYYLDKKYLVNDLKDTVLEKEVYVRTSYNINKDLDSTDVLTLAKKVINQR